VTTSDDKRRNTNPGNTALPGCRQCIRARANAPCNTYCSATPFKSTHTFLMCGCMNPALPFRRMPPAAVQKGLGHPCADPRPLPFLCTQLIRLRTMLQHAQPTAHNTSGEGAGGPWSGGFAKTQCSHARRPSSQTCRKPLGLVTLQFQRASCCWAHAGAGPGCCQLDHEEVLLLLLSLLLLLLLFFMSSSATSRSSSGPAPMASSS
jgi:hypothetical protein